MLREPPGAAACVKQSEGNHYVMLLARRSFSEGGSGVEEFPYARNNMLMQAPKPPVRVFDGKEGVVFLRLHGTEKSTPADRGLSTHPRHRSADHRGEFPGGEEGDSV